MHNIFSIDSINELRQKYLDFFKDKNHLIYPSASLKSEDPTLFFTSAGMVQFKPYFLGAIPKFAGVDGTWHRVTTAQKCLRINDIENVGRTLRHHSFFEMMGNFSFGDYFKKEAASWAWEFLTQHLNFAPEKLYITVYQDDDEAFEVWEQHVGVPSERISRWGEDENFWPANAVSQGPNGPCGPCSEIFFDRGTEFGSAGEIGPNTGSGDRFIEVWNLVFTQFDRQDDGQLEPLPQKNIDTGLGFERLVAVISGQEDAYATELFQPTIRKVVELSAKPYEGKKSISHRVIADHIRAITFIISDGILPANIGEGYVVKMLLRRAARHAYLLGLKEPILYSLVEQVVESMGATYPELEPAKEQVKGIIHTEEKQFLRTLEQGINRANTILDNLGTGTLPGEVAFNLWQTYGFPLDLTKEMATERGIKVDQQGYAAAKEKAKEVSRAQEDESSAIFVASKDTLGLVAKTHGETIFVGYKQIEIEASVLALLQGEGFVDSVSEGGEIDIILDHTPFYAESGGQVADKGAIYWQDGHSKVLDTQKSKEGLYSHKVKVVKGNLTTNTRVKAVVSLDRLEVEKHHSATHLLHAALRIILGNHVAQTGSLVEPERLRFDFSHGSALTRENIEHIEILVNRWIQANFQVSWQNMPIAEARQTGAMMLFGEKYGSVVRVVKIGGTKNTVSIELCGGTHVKHTGNIGNFIVTAEEAVSAGMRRIEAVVGEMAVRQMQNTRFTEQVVAKRLNAGPSEIANRIEKLQAELKESQQEVLQLRNKLATTQTSELNLDLKKVAGFSYSTAILRDLDANALRNAADSLLKKSKADFVVLASGKLMVVKVNEEARAKGIHAGNIIRKLAELVGGGGGGRAEMAQAGIKDLSKLPSALEAIPEILNS